MSGSCCAKFPGYYAALGLHMAIAFTFAGLFSSTNNMFVFVQVPTCAPGTTATLSQASRTQPYCTPAALFSNVIIPFDKIGYIGVSRSGLTSLHLIETGESVDLCVRSSCATIGADGSRVAVDGVLASAAGLPSILQISDVQLVNLTSKLTGLASMYLSDSRTVLDFTNLPVKFSPNGGGSLPSGLSSSTVYYLRPVPSGYAVATSPSVSPLTTIAAVSQPGSFSFVSEDYHGGCPNQASPLATIRRPNPSNDGTLKERACGFCLNEVQRVGLLTVPGTSGSAIVLMLLLAILMMIPAARKGNWFKCFTLFIAFVSIVFLITAVAVGYVMMASVLGCAYGSSTLTANLNLEEQFAPIAYNAAGSAFGGSIPSSLGAPEAFNCAIGTIYDRPACYNKPVGLLPSFGAVYLIVALLVLFVWACVVAFGIDFKLDDAVAPPAPK